MGFKGRHVISIRDFSKEEILHILDVAEGMVSSAKGESRTPLLEGRILATLFYEPSTRTRLSFETAMLRLGGSIMGFSEPKGTSIAKGETLADTIRMASAYADAIVLRHPQEGAARMAAEFSDKVVLNGGDGAGQHPTQTLLDLFTIRRHAGLDGTHVALVGDLKYGRTVHSLAYALGRFGCRMTFVAPPVLQMPKEVVDHLIEEGAEAVLKEEIREAMEADVLYMTRIQKERFPDPTEYAQVAGLYRLTADLVRETGSRALIMHPLPRMDEIAPDVDGLPNAVYFEQAFNGVPVRMALLALTLGAVE